jgi:hypothetical protein
MKRLNGDNEPLRILFARAIELTIQLPTLAVSFQSIVNYPIEEALIKVDEALIKA